MPKSQQVVTLLAFFPRVHFSIPPPPSQPYLIGKHINFGTTIIADITYQDEVLSKQLNVITMQIQTNLLLDVMLFNYETVDSLQVRSCCIFYARVLWCLQTMCI